MIELFSADTPNGKKITIMLEEIGYKYKLTNINLIKGEQFNPDFKKISPFSKIPVIIDHDNNVTIFESGNDSCDGILLKLTGWNDSKYDEPYRRG